MAKLKLYKCGAHKNHSHGLIWSKQNLNQMRKEFGNKCKLVKQKR